MKRSAPMGHRTPRPRSAARTANHRHVVRTARGSILASTAMNAWTRTKVAQNIKRKSKTTGSPNSPNNTREMAVMIRRLFTHAAPRHPGLVVYRGMTVKNAGNIRTRENGPTSWTNRKNIAKVFSKKNLSKKGVVLALTLNNKTPVLNIKKNPLVKWSWLGEHVLPPGNFTIGNKNNNVYRVVKFEPNAKYLKPWTFY